MATGKIIAIPFSGSFHGYHTTGFTTVDYEQWPELSKMVLFLLMFMGGCAGSTGGAIKQIRVLLIIKAVKRKLKRLIHPKSCFTDRGGGFAGAGGNSG